MQCRARSSEDISLFSSQGSDWSCKYTRSREKNTAHTQNRYQKLRHISTRELPKMSFHVYSSFENTAPSTETKHSLLVYHFTLAFVKIFFDSIFPWFFFNFTSQKKSLIFIPSLEKIPVLVYTQPIMID
jgi:hypothetical protein